MRHGWQLSEDVCKQPIVVMAGAEGFPAGNQ